MPFLFKKINDIMTYDFILKHNNKKNNLEIV